MSESPIAVIGPRVIAQLGTILIGFVMSKTKFFNNVEVENGVGALLAKVFLPCLIFQAIATLHVDAIHWDLTIAIFYARTSTFIITIIASLYLDDNKRKGRALGKAVMRAMFTTSTNDFAIGLPIALALYGPDSSNPRTDIINMLYVTQPITLAFLNPIGFMILEYGKMLDEEEKRPPNASDQNGKSKCGAVMRMLGMIGAKVAKNPLVIASVGGVIWNVCSGGVLPPVVIPLFTLNAQAYIAGALVVLGSMMVTSTEKVAKLEEKAKPSIKKLSSIRSRPSNMHLLDSPSHYDHDQENRLPPSTAAAEDPPSPPSFLLSFLLSAVTVVWVGFSTMYFADLLGCDLDLRICSLVFGLVPGGSQLVTFAQMYSWTDTEGEVAIGLVVCTLLGIPAVVLAAYYAAFSFGTPTMGALPEVYLYDPSLIWTVLFYIGAIGGLLALVVALMSYVSFERVWRRSYAPQAPDGNVALYITEIIDATADRGYETSGIGGNNSVNGTKGSGGEVIVEDVPIRANAPPIDTDMAEEIIASGGTSYGGWNIWSPVLCSFLLVALAQSLHALQPALFLLLNPEVEARLGQDGGGDEAGPGVSGGEITEDEVSGALYGLYANEPVWYAVHAILLYATKCLVVLAVWETLGVYAYIYNTVQAVRKDQPPQQQTQAGSAGAKRSGGGDIEREDAAAYTGAIFVPPVQLDGRSYPWGKYWAVRAVFGLALPAIGVIAFYLGLVYNEERSGAMGGTTVEEGSEAIAEELTVRWQLLVDSCFNAFAILFCLIGVRQILFVDRKLTKDVLEGGSSSSSSSSSSNGKSENRATSATAGPTTATTDGAAAADGVPFTASTALLLAVIDRSEAVLNDLFLPITVYYLAYLGTASSLEVWELCRTGYTTNSAYLVSPFALPLVTENIAMVNLVQILDRLQGFVYAIFLFRYVYVTFYSSPIPGAGAGAGAGPDGVGLSHRRNRSLRLIDVGETDEGNGDGDANEGKGSGSEGGGSEGKGGEKAGVKFSSPVLSGYGGRTGRAPAPNGGNSRRGGALLGWYRSLFPPSQAGNSYARVRAGGGDDNEEGKPIRGGHGGTYGSNN